MGKKAKKEQRQLAEGERDLEGENKMLQKKLEVLQYRLMLKDEAISTHMKNENSHKLYRRS